MGEKPAEIKQVSEREIWVGESRYYLGEDNILYETLVGDQDERIALASKEATGKLHNMVEGKVRVLIDLNKAGRPSPKARKIGQEAFDCQVVSDPESIRDGIETVSIYWVKEELATD